MSHDNEKSKKSDFGRSGAEEVDKGKGKTKYDKPSTPDEDVAIDERRDKPIRGPESHDGKE
ncbi:hypothetical protein [Palleronia abyssalis]|uniref:Uncharacterized protein n=1 Tax=Palleronia abyssalis TaxID=1501240 RepID=A0A2R8BTX7_9RHOB|nr:hypothetical protein [Palleronia abyssalis]SPJ23602.1 hypothetical protein PAA8504_01415 [Palleronia abyssalis]